MDDLTDDEVKYLSSVLEVYKKTIAYDLDSVEDKEIEDKISKILEKSVSIKGNGLTSDIKATIKD
jgi:hypothetical protein